VVAPTRETAAQALAATLLVVPVARLLPAMARLGDLVGCGDWEGRHAGLLGIKYVLAARPDAAPLLLPSALSAGLAGLQVPPWTFPLTLTLKP
jgi:TATA-binding protein-associated factor